MVGNSHDASLAVFENNKLLWASLAKDFSGVSHDPNPDDTQIAVAVQSFGKPDNIIWYERPFLKTLRQLRAGQGWKWKENNIRTYLKPYLNVWDIDVPITYTQHHESHAAYAYYTQPYDDCAVICLDSIGEFETLTIWHGKDGKLKKIYSQGYPHSLGLFYSAMTQRMGFTPQRDEYLVAKHAKAGNPKRLAHTMRKEIIDVNHEKWHPQKIKMRENLHRGCLWWRPELKTVQDMADIAAATQAIFEYAVNCLSIWTKVQTGSPNVALAGGGALNRDAIDKIRKHWDNVWVPPNPGDPGSCIGTVLAQTKSKVDVDKVWYKKV
jgi:carbamoyltransferase